MKKILLTLIGCLLLVGCGNKELDLEKVKNKLSKSAVYGELKMLSNTDLNNLYSIDSNLADEILYQESTDANEVDLYLIVKAKDEKIKEQIAARFEQLELLCEMYDAKNAQKVRNRLETTYNGYEIYIISDNNEKVLEEIKNS